jgi:CBS domain-containing protein
MITTVGQMLEGKGSDVWSVGPEATVFEALRLMADRNVGAVLVRSGEQLVGILSERDYARKVALLGKASKDTPVRDVMSSKVYFVRPDQTASDCMATMTEKRIRHLPAMHEGKLVGMISIGDVVRAILAEQQFTIQQLETYISSGG